MPAKIATASGLKNHLKKINRDLDQLDEMLSKIEEQVVLEDIEKKI